MFERLACTLATWFGTPLAIAGQVLVTVASLLTFGVEATTLVLSIEAITLSQLVLVAQGRTERVILAALPELLRAVPDADESVAEQ